MANTQITERVYDLEVLDAPIGQALLLTAGLGIANAAAGMLSGVIGIPGAATKAALALLAVKIGAVRDFLGPGTSTILSAGLLATAINDTMGLEGRAEDFFAGLFGRVAEIGNSTPGARLQNEKRREALQAPPPKLQAPAPPVAVQPQSYYDKLMGRGG